MFEVRGKIATGLVIAAPLLGGAAVLGGGGAAVLVNPDCAAATHCHADTLGPNIGNSGGTADVTKHRVPAIRTTRYVSQG